MLSSVRRLLSSIRRPRSTGGEMKFLIAGLGSVGRRHLRNLLALGERDIVLLRSGRSTLPDDELASFPVEHEIERALERHRPQAVIVATPTALHLPIVRPAVEAGCHILLEKPVSHDLSGLDELRQAIRRSGSRILVGFQFRFHPTLQRARELLREGAIGQVFTFHVHWGEYLPQWHPWEDYRQSYAARRDLGGGVIRTLTHPFDYLRFLLGEIRALWAFRDHISPLEMDVEDVAEIGLHLENGALGGLHLNYLQRPPVHRWEIAGSQGTLRWDNADGQLTLYRMPAPFGSWSEKPAPPQVETFAPPPDFERNHLFLAEMRHFLDVVRGEAEPLCTLDDGIRALELALAAHRSADEGRLVAINHHPSSPTNNQ